MITPLLPQHAAAPERLSVEKAAERAKAATLHPAVRPHP